MGKRHDEMHDVSVEVERIARRVGDPEGWDDKRDALEGLTQIRALRLQVDAQLRALELEAAQEAFRFTARWGEIAQAAGVTRQTAQATYRDRENKPRHQPRRPEPQHVPAQARRPSWRDTNSWPEAMASEGV